MSIHDVPDTKYIVTTSCERQHNIIECQSSINIFENNTVFRMHKASIQAFNVLPSLINRIAASFKGTIKLKKFVGEHIVFRSHKTFQQA
jgi:hypothetical protein